MKKRMWSILLTLCMVLSLLPTTALASGDDTGMAMATNYEELVNALKDSTVTELTIYPRWPINIENNEYEYFTWPEGEVTLNLDAANSACMIYLGNGTWTIPEHVTVNAYDTVYIGSPTGTDMVIDGTWNCMSNQAIIGNVSGGGALYGALTVNGTLAVDKGLRVSPAKVGSFTLNGTLKNAGVCYINNMTMANGAAVVNVPDPEITNSMREIYLEDGGSITGPSTGSASIGGQITVSKDGTLSGSLTADQITLCSGSALTVADGADVTIMKLTCNGTSSSPAAINVNGRLSLTTNGYNTVSNTTITLEENGVLALSPKVQFGEKDGGSTIEGEGTLELYGIVNEHDNCSQAPMVFSVSSKSVDDATGEYVPLTGVSDAVHVVRKWTQCQSHSWSEAATVAPTCGAIGYDVEICSICGTERQSNRVPSTGAHTIAYKQNGTSGATAACSVCGMTGMVSIRVPESSYVATGKAITPAVLSKMGSLEESIPDAGITYTNNVEPGTATASAVFGDVTISTTFEIVACDHEGGAADCTHGPICSKCGLEYGQPLGHTGGAATCKEQAACTRCGETYGALADHTYVLKSNADMHWVECSVCGLACLQDYGLAVTSPSQIPDKVLLELVCVYLDQQGGGTIDQSVYLEQYGNTPSRHAYSGASCTDAGACLLCGYGKAAGSHIWNDGEVTTAATCTETGVITYTCTSCGETKTEDIPVTDHTEVVIPGTADTCTETGLTDGKMCSVCGTVTVEQTTIPAKGHTSTERDCAKQDVCDVCKEVIRDAGQHDWGSWTVTKEAACMEDGSRKHTCAICGVEASEAIPSLGHDYESVVTAPTCTEKGYTTHTCSRCGAAETQVVSKLQKQAVSWLLDQITWTYGSITDVTNTAYNDTEGGGALTYSSNDERVATVDANGQAAIVGAGTATITVTAAKVPGLYAETSASYTLIIRKAALTVTARDAAITYGQAPANNGWTASGFAYDDGADDVTGTAVYTCSYEQYGKAGTYAIHVSGLSAANYDITFVPGTLTVSKAADYTITLDNLTQRDDSITSVTASIAPQDATAQIQVEYQVNDQWTTDLPTAAGEYAVRASLTASDNIQTDSAFTSGTLTIQQSVEVDGTGVSVTVDGGKAEITVTEDELADIVDNAEGDVSMNLGGVEGVDELVLPGSLLEALSESDKAGGLTITTEDASISMGGAVLDTVASAITGDEDTVAVKLAAVEEEDLTDLQQEALNSITQEAVIVEVSLVITHADGSPDTELHQLGGNVEITVPFTGEVPEGKYIVVCYLSDDGNVTYVRAAYDAETKQITFTTNHFSNYAAFVSGKPTAAVTVSGGSGSGIYLAGDTVAIKADSKSGCTFAGWEIVSGSVTLANAKAAETTFTMPAANVELRATYTKTTSVKPAEDMTGSAKWTEKSDENPFTDVDGDAYYAGAVIWAVGEGITSGTTSTTFTPDAACTRAQAVAFLWRAAGSPAPKSSANPFADVKADAYYYDAVLWAVEQGITKGTGDNTFSPNVPCTRAQIVTFLWRALKAPAADGVNPFTDVVPDAYYANAVLWAVENGVTSGTTAATFSPGSICTRAQIVTFLFRTIKE